MKKLLLIFCLLFMCASARATTITVSSYAAPSGWAYGSPLTLRIYVNGTFVDTDGIVHMAQATGGPNFYQAITCTSSSGTITIPSFTIASTTDSPTNPSATYSFIFYDKNGVRRDTFVAALPIPTILGTTVTWGRLFTYLAGHPTPPRPGFPDQQQVQALINAVLPAPKASDVINGILETSVPPVSSVNPKALGPNDPRLGAVFNVTGYPYLSVCDGSTADTAAIASAVTAAATVGGSIYIPPSASGCKIGTATINVPVISDGGSFVLTTGQTTTFTKAIVADPATLLFRNAASGQGTVSFTGNASLKEIYPDWWTKNASPGTTDMTTAIQAAITATQGRGRVGLLEASYLVTATLRLPTLTDTFGPLTIQGAGRCLSNLVNKASANKPTLLIDRGLVTVRGVGFWGDANFPNDGIKVSTNGSRVFIEDGNSFYMQGNGIFIEQAHSIWIRNNVGAVSGGTGLAPVGVTTPITAWGANDSFIYVNIPNAGFVNQLVVANNISEGYSYAVQVVQAGSGAGVSFSISDNQFEGAASGIKLVAINEVFIHGNYIGEGSTGYAIDLDNCRYIDVGPNHIHLDTVDSKSSTVKLNNVLAGAIRGYIPRLYITSDGSGYGGVVVAGAQIDRLQDETSDHMLSMVNVETSEAVPRSTFNMRTGQSTWDSDSVSIVAYPTVRLGDQILKRTPVSGASPGWIATTASAAGALVQVTGSGPDPVVLNDYAEPMAYDFRITMLSGGVTGTATYKVEWKTAGGGSYADLTNTITTTELAYLIKRQTGSGTPTVTFQIRWPTGQTYVIGDKWTLTAVVAPVWKALPAIA